MLLEVEDLTVRFGGVCALDCVSLDVDPGEVCGLIGPNGAGKTTLFDCVSRLREPAGGAIRIAGDDVLSLRPHDVAALGVARTFQTAGLVPDLSVRENVMLGAQRTQQGGLVAAIRPRRARRAEAELHATAQRWIEILGLEGFADDPADALSHGTRRRVELARALCQRPRLLLLDEPAGGLSRAEVERLIETLHTVRSETDAGVLLVDHHMALVMSVSDRVVALDFGRKIADGPPVEVQRDPTVVEAYLGPAP